MSDWSGVDGRLRALVRRSEQATAVLGPEGRLLYANAAFERDYGYSPREATGMNVLDHIHPGDLLRVEREVSAGESPEERTGEVGYRFRCADGSWRWVEASVMRLEGREESPRFLLVAHDAGSAAGSGESRLRQVLDQVPDVVIVHDERGRVLDCNREACRSLGYTREELLSLSVQDFAVGLISEEERRAAGGDTLWLRAIASEPGETVGYHGGLHRRKDGSIFPVEVAVGAVEHEGRRRILAVCRDVTEGRRLEKEIEHQSLHDPLTGLANRLLFTEQLERALARAEIDSTPVSLVLISLDDLRNINDLFGYAAGDLALVDFARRLRNGLRPGTMICRLGSGDFAALLERSGREEAEETARRLLRALETPLTLDDAGRQVVVTATVGLASTEDSGAATAEDLLRDATLALARKRAENAGPGGPSPDEPA